jgi:hypothetical protein
MARAEPYRKVPDRRARDPSDIESGSKDSLGIVRRISKLRAAPSRFCLLFGAWS